MAIGTRDDNKFMLRMPDGLRESIKDAAHQNNRSINSEIISRLEASLAAPASLHPALAEMLDQHIESEVTARLRAIALKISAS